LGEEQAWLRKHQQDYDETYQEKTMTEAEYVEHLYHLQQEKRMTELDKPVPVADPQACDKVSYGSVLS
jgi:hypothetical protein